MSKRVLTDPVQLQGGEDLKKAAKCPLCYSMVAARELRLVQIQHVKPPQVMPIAMAAVSMLLPQVMPVAKAAAAAVSMLLLQNVAAHGHISCHHFFFSSSTCPTDSCGALICITHQSPPGFVHLILFVRLKAGGNASHTHIQGWTCSHLHLYACRSMIQCISFC